MEMQIDQIVADSNSPYVMANIHHSQQPHRPIVSRWLVDPIIIIVSLSFVKPGFILEVYNGINLKRRVKGKT